MTTAYCETCQVTYVLTSENCCPNCNALIDVAAGRDHFQGATTPPQPSAAHGATEDVPPFTLTQRTEPQSQILSNHNGLSRVSGQNQATSLLSTFIGFGMCIFSLILSFAVVPMLLFAKDQLDLKGGVAGTVVITIMFIAGLVLVLRERTPLPLLRAFYFLIGGLAVVGGMGIFVLAAYRASSGEHLNKKAFGAPVVMVVLGVAWIRQGLALSTRSREN